MPSSTPARLGPAFIPFGVIGVVHVVALLAAATWPDASPLAAATKMLLMPMLALGFLRVAPTGRARATLLVLAALLLSWLGDLALLVQGETAFLVGLCAFLVAHVFFVLLIARHLAVRRLPFAALAYLGWWIALMALLAPHVGWLVWPLAAYGLVLGVMAATATRAPATVVVGGLLFLVSDTVLGVARFMPSIELWNSHVLVMVAYIAAQGLLVLGAARHLQNGVAGATDDDHDDVAAPGVAPVSRADASVSS